jgi:hypothetical protein
MFPFGHSGLSVGAEELEQYTIVMWYGALASIPAGWTLCDGTLGTPDLRNMFVRGAPAGSPADNTIRGSNAHEHGGLTGLKTTSSIFLTGTTASATLGHTHTIAADDNMPEYKRIVFIMKT